jgi:EAL domain-containing protein (putative c-di-GMP-specific phosphodiesterase class I)
VTRPLEPYAGLSVLVVDDNASNVLFVRSLLEQQGLVRIYSVTDSRDVVGELSDKRPDLVILDLHMPHLDGFQVLDQIHAHAAGRFLPVLVLTADSTTTARNRALEQGAQDFLVKPLDTVETTLRIANLLETVQLYATLRQQAATLQNEPASADAAEMLDRIEAVLRNRTITMALQPVVDTRTLEVVGHEALSRFPDPQYGGPDAWFADAVAVGRGVELEWLAATKALTHLDGEGSDFLAVNLSPAAVVSVTHLRMIPARLCGRVVIELTEHEPVEDYAALHRALAPIREEGARLAADDLGSGYAGFRHLIRLQPDIIKLDIALVSGIHRNAGKRALARALVSFADEVGAEVIAEGVEEADELEVLRELDVRWAQGYYLGRPETMN